MTGLRLRRRSSPRRPELSRDDAAGRVSAYVYGNVLVMAALISLDPADLRGPTAVLYVLGVGLSTLVAHVVGNVVGQRVRQREPGGWNAVLHEIRDSLPIAVAALVPAAILLPAWAQRVNPDVALVVALAETDLRLALLGSAVERLAGERSSRRVLLAGFGLAVIAAGAAVLKWRLTH